MTKRPTLSLSPPQQNNKRRPSAFKVAPAPSKPTSDAHADQPAEPAAPTSAPPPASVSFTARAKRTDASPSKGPNWLNAGIIVKAMLIAGTVALSIFLLKRRLF